MVEPTRTATALQRPSRRGSDELRANVESVVSDREEVSTKFESAIGER
jgi:hypothetical protein